MAGLNIAYVPGVTPGKWLKRWQERHPNAPLKASRYDAPDPLVLLRSGEADLVFVRFPVGKAPVDTLTHVIRLYEELPVVCAAKDNDIELYEEEVPLADLEGEAFLDLADYPEDIGGVGMAMEVVSSGAGMLIVPQSVARLHHRKDVVYRILTGVPETSIGVAWNRPLGDDPDDLVIEEFIGIVRGRGENSSRQPSVQERQQEAAGQARKKRQGADAKGSGGAAKGGKGAGSKSKPGAKGGPRRGPKPGGRSKKR